MREFHCLTFHSSREDLKAAAAGALGGAAGGVFVASGAGIVAGALGAGTLTTSGAVGTMSLVSLYLINRMLLIVSDRSNLRLRGVCSAVDRHLAMLGQGWGSRPMR